MTAERSNDICNAPAWLPRELGWMSFSARARRRCPGRRPVAHPAGRREPSMVTSRIPIPLAILGVLLSAGTAGAQKARYTRQQDIKIDAKLSERSRPVVP